MQVYYDDKDHSYYVLEGTRKVFYTSVTHLINLYKQPFDKKKMAEITARKKGNTPEYWIKQWEKISKQACDYGAAIHDRIEQSLIATGTETINGKVLTVQGQVSIDLTDYLVLEDGVYTELKLWHHGHLVAGRTDKAIITSSGTVRYMNIEDYKTNKVLNLTSYQFPDGSYKMMQSPLSHLQDCNYNHYVLQLSLYQFMAESMGFSPGYRKIIHISREGEVTEYQLPYLREEIVAMLNHKNQANVKTRRSQKA